MKSLSTHIAESLQINEARKIADNIIDAGSVNATMIKNGDSIGFKICKIINQVSENIGKRIGAYVYEQLPENDNNEVEIEIGNTSNDDLIDSIDKEIRKQLPKAKFSISKNVSLGSKYEYERYLLYIGPRGN